VASPRSSVEVIRGHLGFVPGAIAVLGKWEPLMSPTQSRLEVSARVAAAVGLSEVLQEAGEPTPFLLSAEGQMRGLPRSGCQMAAETMIELGASRQQIRCWPTANRTLVELRSLDRMRCQLTAGGLLLMTSNYHVPRTGHILRRFRLVGPTDVLSCSHPVVAAAFGGLSDERREALLATIRRGTRHGLALLPVAVTEGLGFLSGSIPRLEARLADALRGSIPSDQTEMRLPD